MSRRRGRRRLPWPAAAAAALALIALAAALILLGIGAVRLTGNVLGSLNGGSDAEPDPMFREEAEMVTMPPDLGMPQDDTTYSDNSARWDTSVQTPVDQSAAELARQALEQAQGEK